MEIKDNRRYDTDVSRADVTGENYVKVNTKLCKYGWVCFDLQAEEYVVIFNDEAFDWFLDVFFNGDRNIISKEYLDLLELLKKLSYENSCRIRFTHQIRNQARFIEVAFGEVIKSLI